MGLPGTPGSHSFVPANVHLPVQRGTYLEKEQKGQTQLLPYRSHMVNQVWRWLEAHFPYNAIKAALIFKVEMAAT